MPREIKSLVEMASINLLFALAELDSLDDRDSIQRSLDHIRQAKACLNILSAEYETPTDEVDAA